MISGLLILLVAALLAPPLRALIGPRAGVLLAAAPAFLFFRSLDAVPAVSSGSVLLERAEWIPSIGVDLAFRTDGLSLLFLLLIYGIGAIVLVFSAGYLAKDTLQGRFFSLVLLFLIAMAGLVTADNLILLFVFWELTSAASYFLISYYHTDKAARRAALRALIITGGGGLALLAGLVLIGLRCGTFSLSEILQQKEALTGDPRYPLILSLILIGAFTKSAQFPFHFWLPGAMAAPAPVSALLHSATMVKAGVFLLARFFPALGGTPEWHTYVTGFGAATMLAGAVIAVAQTDLKRLLAYSTVSALGTLTMLIGLGTKEAHKAAVVFLLVHAAYKAALFLVSGTVDHETHTRDVRRLGGLLREMPLSATAAIISALSMCGLPPMLGFISKELIYEAKIQTPEIAGLVITAGVAANVLIVATAVAAGLRPYLRTKLDDAVHGHEAPWTMWSGPLLLAALSLIWGAMPHLLQESVVRPAIEAVRSEPAKIKLVLWHGINPVLGLSVLTLVLGALVFMVINPLRRFRVWLAAKAAACNGDRIFDAVFDGILAGGKALTKLTQHGYLRGYIAVIMIFSGGVLLWASGVAGAWKVILPHFQSLFAPSPAVVLLILVMCAAAVTAAAAKSRLMVLSAFGIVGFGIALLFAWHGAPDLALTQFFVETLLLILILLVIGRLPRFEERRGRRLGDLALSAAAGVLLTVVTLHALDVQTSRSISGYFVENAPEAKGNNVVNVILVDFRALDTMGEIIVLAVAALGASALLRRRAGRGPAEPVKEDTP